MVPHKKDSGCAFSVRTYVSNVVSFPGYRIRGHTMSTSCSWIMLVVVPVRVLCSFFPAFWVLFPLQLRNSPWGDHYFWWFWSEPTFTWLQNGDFSNSPTPSALISWFSKIRKNPDFSLICLLFCPFIFSMDPWILIYSIG